MQTFFFFKQRLQFWNRNPIKKNIFLPLSLLCLLLAPLSIASQNNESTSLLASGPEKGRLLLLGGGISDHHAQLFQKFAGGEEAKIVVIPTAFSDKKISKDPEFAKVRSRFESLGISNIEILHTRNRETANTETFIEPIKQAGGIFILGGNTKNISDAYLNTRTQEAIQSLLERGGIVAGVSAGSGIQAAYFSPEGLQLGFELLKGVIIMNHFLAKNKQFDHINEIVTHRERIAIGIDDRTGILVQNNQFEVIGESYVAIYDQSYYNRHKDSISRLPLNSERFYLLKNGDCYHLNKREIITNSRLTPLKFSDSEIREYTGYFKANNKDFAIEFICEKDTLRVKNSWGWTVYPIYPLEKDLFFATNRNMWFQFVREKGEIIAVKKMKSVLQDKVIVELMKTPSSK